MTKYNSESYYGIVDNIETLEAKDDAATQFMGDGWRMPTKADLQELSVNTDSEWVTNYNGSGVNGYKFTSSNGNSIFIPAAGNCYNGSVHDVGYNGGVWSSSLNTSASKDAWYLFLSSGDCRMRVNQRDSGQPVRGVRK